MATILEFGISRMTKGLSCEMRTSGKASDRFKELLQARLRQRSAPPNPLHHGAKESSSSAAVDVSADQILHSIFGSGEGGAGFS